MKLYFTILFVVVSSVMFAQQKISGTITDSQNNPLIGVTVFVEELQKGTSTNENGYYELKNLPNHPIKISVVYIGFETQVKTIDEQKNETTLNFSLKEAVFKMEEIIISTPFNKLQSENVMKVDKATVQQVKTKLATIQCCVFLNVCIHLIIIFNCTCWRNKNIVVNMVVKSVGENS